MNSQNVKTEKEAEPTHSQIINPEIVVEAEGGIQVFRSAQIAFDKTEAEKQKLQKEVK